MSCMCTGMCRTTGGCPNRGRNDYFNYPYPHPHSTTPEYYRVYVKDEVMYPLGWICPKCKTANNPANSTCGNPHCE